MRKSIEESWRYLESRGERAPRRPNGVPWIHERMPNHDDSEVALSYFRLRIEDADYGNLSLPRTFFGRSWFVRLSFVNTDLSESRMCWNEFENCDFSKADMSECDMRATIFKGCKFVETILHGSDLRTSFFEECDFSDALVAGAIAEKDIRDGCLMDLVSREQRTAMVWSTDAGPEPPGG